MSIRVVLSCNGEQAFEPCRQAIPVGVVQTGREAREIAKRIGGWSSETKAFASKDDHVQDYCSSCTKLRAERKAAMARHPAGKKVA